VSRYNIRRKAEICHLTEAYGLHWCEVRVHEPAENVIEAGINSKTMTPVPRMAGSQLTRYCPVLVAGIYLSHFGKISKTFVRKNSHTKGIFNSTFNQTANLQLTSFFKSFFDIKYIAVICLYL